MIVIVPGMPLMAAALAPGSEGIFLAKQVLTICGLGMLIGSPAIGWCVQRAGYRPVLLAGLAAFTLFGVIGYVTENAWTLISSRFALGVAAAAILTSSYALVAYYFDGHERARMLGYIASALGLVGMLAAAAAGKVASVFGWHALFLIFGITALPLLGAFLVITARDGSRSAIVPEKKAVQEKVPLRAVLGIYVLAALFTIMSINPAAQIPFMLAARGISDPQIVSLIVFVICGAKFVAAPFYVRLSARFSTATIMALMCLMFAIGHVIAGGIGGLTSALVGTGVIGLGMAMIQPVCANYVFTNVPANAHGGALGGLFGCTFLGSFINPVFMMPFNAAFGMEKAFVVVGALNVVLALGFAVAVSLRHRRDGAEQLVVK